MFYLLYGIVYPAVLFAFFYTKNKGPNGQHKDPETGRYNWLAEQKKLGEDSPFFRRWGYFYVWNKDEYWWYGFMVKIRWEAGIIVMALYSYDLDV